MSQSIHQTKIEWILIFHSDRVTKFINYMGYIFWNPYVGSACGSLADAHGNHFVHFKLVLIPEDIYTLEPTCRW